MALYTKQSTQLKNKIHRELVLGSVSKAVLKSLKLQLKRLTIELEKLEALLEEKVKESYKTSLTLLQSIPGISKKVV